MEKTTVRRTAAAFALVLFCALALMLFIACESPTTITNANDNVNTIGDPPLECDLSTTEEINGECVALTCDDGFDLDDEGECVESEGD